MVKGSKEALAECQCHPELTLAGDGSFTFDATGMTAGPVTFTYTATDGVHTSAAATATINVFDVVTGILALEADAQVIDGVSADLNFDHPINLYARHSSPDETRETFMRFDLAGVTGEVTEATVRMYVNNTGAAGLTNALLPVDDDSWDAQTITWNTKPASGPQIDNWTPQIGTWQEIDVTELVRAVVDDAGDDALSLRLRSLTNVGSSGFTVYRGKDWSETNLRPQLVLSGGFDPVAPAGWDDLYTTWNEGSDLVTSAVDGVLANDTDLNSDALTATKLTDPANGTLVSFGSDGSFVYDPDDTFEGTDTFTYEVSDSVLVSGTVTVSINVLAGSGQPQTLAEGENSGDPAGELLTGESINLAFDAVLAGWIGGGLDVRAADLFNDVPILITDLPDGMLGYTYDGVIYLDADAAGYGWYVDATPLDDEEFALTTEYGTAADTDSEAFGKVDLVTVLSHEFGHILGLADLGTSGDLMSGLLTLGTRRSNYAEAVDSLFAQGLWTAYQAANSEADSYGWADDY